MQRQLGFKYVHCPVPRLFRKVERVRSPGFQVGLLPTFHFSEISSRKRGNDREKKKRERERKNGRGTPEAGGTEEHFLEHWFQREGTASLSLFLLFASFPLWCGGKRGDPVGARSKARTHTFSRFASIFFSRSWTVKCKVKIGYFIANTLRSSVSVQKWTFYGRSASEP